MSKEEYDSVECRCGHRADAHEGATFVLPCGFPGCGCDDFVQKDASEKGGKA